MKSFVKPRRAVIYVRLSVAAEESVSIERQIKSARKYCEAREMEVVHVAIDDGVSATKNRPEQRDGWREVLDLKQQYDAVVVWKVDRLARRVLDFLNADQALQDRGAALMAVEDPIDMSTPQGRAFATMLAVFGEMEAAAISARVTAARQHLTSVGRVAGGERPWPYELARNPEGHGYILQPIPERAEAIRAAAEDLIAHRANATEIGRRWDRAGLAPKGKKKNGKPGKTTWNPTSIRNLLRNPTLYGAIIYRGKVLRDEDFNLKLGTHAILDRGTWEQLQAALDGEKVGSKIKNPPLLQGIAYCENCDGPMHAMRTSTRPISAWKYRCTNRECPHGIYVSMYRLEEMVTKDFLRHFGDLKQSSLQQGTDPGIKAELVTQLMDLDELLQNTDDDEEGLRIIRRRKEVRADLTKLQDDAGALLLPQATGRHLRDVFDATDVHGQRALMTAVSGVKVTVSAGQRGIKGLSPDRVKIEYHQTPGSHLKTVSQSPESVAQERGEL